MSCSWTAMPSLCGVDPLRSSWTESTTCTMASRTWHAHTKAARGRTNTTVVGSAGRYISCVVRVYLGVTPLWRTNKGGT